MPRTCSALPTRQEKRAAEQVYWKERGKTEAEIEALKSAAEQEMETCLREGRYRTCLPRQNRIVRYVTME